MSNKEAVELFTKLLDDKKNKYEFIKEIDSGNLSRIYRVEDKEYKIPLILKIIEKEKLESGAKNSLEEQIKNEIKILELCKNKSENIIQLLNHFETKLSYVLVFENCKKNLKKYIYKKGPLIEKGTEKIKDILSGIVNGLSFLYDNKIIHRDIKPENIYLQKKGTKLIPKIADFGIATFESENNYEITGTFAYMAPEIMKNSVYDIKSDMWSVGITFYEIITGALPYGKNVTKKMLKFLFAKKILYFNLTENIQLNILFRRLLSIDPKNRMTFPQLKSYVISEDFLENKIYVNDDKDNEKVCNDIIINIDKYNKVEKGKDYLKECTLTYTNEEEQIRNVIKFADLDDIQDIMSYYYGDINNENINNIIYYDGNASKDIFKKSIYGDCEEFERKTNGAFIFCTDIESLNYIMKEIKWAKKKDNRIKFHLIVTGSSCDTVILALCDNFYYDLIEKVCIFCYDITKHIDKMEYYNKIDGVYNTSEKVIKNFIIKYASKDIKPFVITKLLTIRDYKDKYHILHEKTAKYYGKFDKKLYDEAIDKLIEYIKKDKNIMSKNIEELIDSFKKFDEKNCVGDIQVFNQLLIEEYTKNTFYADLNKWLLSLNKNSYDHVAYFTGRFMYCLNSFASKNEKYYNENENLFRGIKLPYSCLQLYERAIGKIIILSSFTSSSLDEEFAKYWSGRDDIEEEYRKKLIFSVIIYIKNVYKKNWITNGVDIRELSEHIDEEEILYLPFSFYYVNDVKVDLKKKTADIYLKTCGKKEIIEKKIKEGKEITIKDENNEKIVVAIEKKNVSK